MKSQLQLMKNLKRTQILKILHIKVEEIQVDEDIIMDIDVSIDGSESDLILEEVDNSFIENKYEGLKIESEEIALVIPLPTRSPVLAPTSSVPTAAPSITGIIASIEISKPVTESLSTIELEEIEKTILDAFNNTEEEVTVNVEYTTQGSMSVDVPEGTSRRRRCQCIS